MGLALCLEHVYTSVQRLLLYLRTAVFGDKTDIRVTPLLIPSNIPGS